jgi:tight adherence protein B
MMSALAAASVLGGLAVAAAVRGQPRQLVEQRLGAVGKAAGPGDLEQGSRPSAIRDQSRDSLSLARGRRRSQLPRPRHTLWAVGALILACMWLDLHLLVPATLVGVAVVGCLRVRSTIASRTQVARRRTRLVETCDQLAAELSAGQSPPRALQHAADAWPELSPVAAAAQLGGDVPAAWRMVAELPGADSLRAVAAAWQVAERSGASLAIVLERMSEGLRADDAVRREVDAALGPPRATARMLAALPAFGLLLGVGMGGDPVGFLLSTPLGAACLAVGVAFAITGVWWVDRLARDAQR